ncbi:hypothetical protein Mapa_002785 [Marchantia paleacea]|nr:hypothetical protein Mapa_002785 [Marchantia paleacea]
MTMVDVGFLSRIVRLWHPDGLFDGDQCIMVEEQLAPSSDPSGHLSGVSGARQLRWAPSTDCAHR